MQSEQFQKVYATLYCRPLLVHADGYSVVKQQDFLLLLLLLTTSFIVEMAIFIFLGYAVLLYFITSIHDNSIGSNDSVLHFVREYTAQRHGPPHQTDAARLVLGGAPREFLRVGNATIKSTGPCLT